MSLRLQKALHSEAFRLFRVLDYKREEYNMTIACSNMVLLGKKKKGNDNANVESPYFESQGPIKVAGNGGNHVTLGYGGVTGVGEALGSAAGAVLVLTDL